LKYFEIKSLFMKDFIVVNNRQNITTEVANIKWWQKKENTTYVCIFSNLLSRRFFFFFFVIKAIKINLVKRINICVFTMCIDEEKGSMDYILYVSI